MTFAQLKAALADRGFNHLAADQLAADVNAARGLLDELYLWPYRETSATGTSPLEVTDLAVIETVANETQGYGLIPVDFRSLVGSDVDPAETGAPQFFYVGQGSIVGTYPTNTDTIGVQYWRATPDLADDADVPLAPARFHPLIVDMAVQRAYMRTDNVQAAQALQPYVDQRLQTMVDALLGGQQITGPQGQSMVFNAVDA